MRTSRLASRLQRMTALLLCVTVSLAGLATAAGAAPPRGTNRIRSDRRWT